MSSEDILIRTSKYICLVLRHNPHSIGLTLDSQGWANVDELIRCSNRNGKHVLDRALLDEIVEKNNKKRFSYSPNGTRIRAVQGHSNPDVKISYELREPPISLFHGTATHFLDSILEKGLIPGKRHHVHLSKDLETALSVGKRHGKVVVLLVDSKRMLQDGFNFYQAENGVWLTDLVPPKYLSLFQSK